MKTIIAFLLAGLALVGLWFLPLLGFKIFICLMIGLGLREYGRMALASPADRRFCIALGVGLGGFLIWAPAGWRLSGIVAGLFLLFLWGMAHKDPFPEAARRMAILWLGVSYLALTLPIWSWVAEFGRQWLLLLLLPASLTDTFAFLVGKTIGRNKVTTISPNKTVEGFVGGLLGGQFAIWLANQLFFAGQLSWSFWVPCGLLVSSLVILGDLGESLLKRSFGTKDSSQIFFGHGGVLDRLDALIFVAPFFYAWILWKGLPS